MIKTSSQRLVCPHWNCPNCLQPVDPDQHERGCYFSRASCLKAFNRACDFSKQKTSELMDVYEAFIEKDGRRGRKYRFYKPNLEQIDAPKNFKAACLAGWQRAMECTKDFIPLTESEWDDALWDPAFVRKLEKCDFFWCGQKWFREKLRHRRRYDCFCGIVPG
jgi:hypothetical protein